MKRTSLLVVAVLAATSGHATAEPDAGVPATVAKALAHYQGGEKHYSISDDWRAMSGETVVCARTDVPDGAGGVSPTSDYSMFFLSGGVIKNMVKDNSLFGCPNRNYAPLAPLPRPAPSKR